MTTSTHKAPEKSSVYAYAQNRYRGIAVLLYVSSVTLLCSLFLRSHIYICDLLSNFCLFGSLVLLINIPCALCLRQWKAASIFLATLCILSFYIAEYTDRAPAQELSYDESIVVMSYNLNTANTQYKHVSDFILQEKPDVLLLLEVDKAWINKLSELDTVYPYKHIKTRSDNFGIALYSQHPMNAQTIFSGRHRIPSISADITIKNTTLRCIGVHTLPPMSADNWEFSLAQIKQVLAQSTYTNSQVIMGDFNATPNSLLYRNIVANKNLMPTGNAFTATWGPISLLQLDHIFVSRNIRVGNSTVHPKLGSDHHPVSVRLALQRTNGS